MLVGRLLAWYPKAAWGAGIMESLVCHEDGAMTERLLKLIRMLISFRASCPFCIDMNSAEFAALGITDEEIAALQGLHGIEETSSFSAAEKAALRYAAGLTSTPVSLTPQDLSAALLHFTEREFTILVSTAAQVNYWARMAQGFGLPPAGFMESCAVLRIGDYTRRADSTP